MYLSVFGLHYTDSFILSAMMVSRTISYYISLILSGAVTLAYHGHLIRRQRRADANAASEGSAESAVDGGNETPPQEGADEPQDAAADAPATELPEENKEDGSV